MERTERGGGKRKMEHPLWLSLLSQKSDLGTERGKWGRQDINSLSRADWKQTPRLCCRINFTVRLEFGGHVLGLILNAAFKLMLQKCL